MASAGKALSMPRPTWKGNITFGLVNVPVALYPGDRKNDLSFHMLDSRNKARVRYERVNEVTGEEVPWDKIVKAFEYEDDNYIMLTDEDFERATVEATRTVEIEDFVDRQSIELPYFDRPYILEPSRNGDKGYVLLREALQQTNKAGIAKVVIRTRQYLPALIAHEEALLLILLRFSNELRKASEFELPKEDIAQYKISKKEVEMAKQLIDAMTVDWDPERYHDDYREALMAWIEKKAKAKGQIVPPEPEEEGRKPAGEIINIMDLLKRSMKETASGRGDAKTTTRTKRSRKSSPAAKRSKPASRPKKKAQ
jgi:DNA end-binding protein Ku